MDVTLRNSNDWSEVARRNWGDRWDVTEDFSFMPCRPAMVHSGLFSGVLLDGCGFWSEALWAADRGGRPLLSSSWGRVANVGRFWNGLPKPQLGVGSLMVLALFCLGSLPHLGERDRVLLSIDERLGTEKSLKDGALGSDVKLKLDM